MNAINNKILIILFPLLCIVSTSESETSLTYFDQTININPSNRPLITGVDLDKIMNRYIDGYNVFERSAMVGPNAMIWLWNVKPDPSDPETQYFWGKKRNTDYYKRQFNLTIGVFSSHQEAVKRAVEFLNSISIIVKLVDEGKKEPGYVAWEKGYTVRDNVFYAVDFCTEPYDRNALQQKLDRDILEGAEGVEKGNAVELPIIDGNEIPDEIVIPLGEKVRVPLKAPDPNSRKIYREVYFYKEKGISNIPTELRSESPLLDWIAPDSVEITDRGNVDGVLRAVVVNNRCVFSDVFEKRVKIKVPDTVK